MNNLRRYLFLLIFVSVSVPVSIVTLITNSNIESTTSSRIFSSFKAELAHVERYLDLLFNQVEARVLFLERNQVVQNNINKLPRYYHKAEIPDDMILPEQIESSELYKTFVEMAQTLQDVNYVYMGDSGGGYLQWPNGPLTDNYDPRIRPWYLGGMAGEGKLTRPPAYFWAPDNNAVLSTVKKINGKNGATAIIGVDFSLQGLTKVLNNMKLGFNGKATLGESTGTILVDTHEEGNLFKSMVEAFEQETSEQLEQMQHHDSKNIVIKGEMFWVLKYELTNLGWSFYFSIPKKELDAELNKVQMYVFVIAVLCVVILTTLGWVLANKITNIIRNRESQLVQAKVEAEQAVIAKSQFLANMSHEIRTPLNGVLGMTQLLAKSQLNSEQNEQVNTILHSGKTLMLLINEILDLSKVEANELTLDPTTTDISQTIKDNVLGFQANARAKQLDLIIDTNNVVDLLLEIDSLRFGQVINNLVSNAIKFTDKGFVAVEVNYDRAEQILTVSVSDSGIGLTEQQQSVVFEKFKQADNTTTRKYGGTGLGLALSTALVELMQGKLKVSSTIGEGSRFYFNIPIRATNKPEEKEAYDWRDKRVLILDDIQLNLTVIGQMLENHGAIVTSYLEPSEASNALQQDNNYDVIIVDYMMPDINGVEWTQQANLNSDCQLILCTSVDESSLLDNQKQLFDYVLYKPVIEQELLSSLKHVTKLATDKSNEFSSYEGKVLVVEDNKVNYMIISAFLTKCGLEVEWADDGEKAVTLFEPEKYDLILMDCMLPGIDGYQATTAIREKEQSDTSPIHIIALTADATPDNEQKCLDAGMNDFLTKPIDMEKMATVLDDFFSS